MKTFKKLNRIIGFIFIFTACLLITNKAILAQDIPITTSSGEALRLFNLGMENTMNLQPDEALDYFDQAVQKDPDFAMAYLYRVMVVSGDLEKHNVNKAVALIDKVSPGEKLLIKVAQAHFDNDRKKETIYINQLVTAYPYDKWAHSLIGILYFETDRNLKVVEHFERVIKVDSTLALPRYYMGYAYMLQGDYKASESAFKQLISLIPTNAKSYGSYAYLLQEMGRFEESTTQFEKAYSINPEYLEYLEMIGDNYLFEDNFVKARECYERVYSTASAARDKINALTSIGKSYIVENQIPQAIEYMHKAGQLADINNRQMDVFLFHIDAALILNETGTPDEALLELEKANAMINQIAGNDLMERVYTTMVMIGKSHALLQQDNLKEAAKEIGKTDKILKKYSLEVSKQNFVHGLLALRESNYEKAISYFSKDEENPLAWYYMAVAYQSSGNKVKSMELFQKISHWYETSIELVLVRNKAIEQIKAAGLSLNE